MVKITIPLKRNESPAVEEYRQKFGHGPAIEAYKFLSAQEIDRIADDADQAGKPYQPWRDRRKTKTGTHLDGAYGQMKRLRRKLSYMLHIILGLLFGV